MQIAPTLLAAAIAVVLVACDGKRDDKTVDHCPPARPLPAAPRLPSTVLAATADSGSTAAQATAGDITITADGALPGFDHKALEKVADIERHEIRAARHALDRKNMKPEVRSYAETLLADSTATWPRRSGCWAPPARMVEKTTLPRPQRPRRQRRRPSADDVHHDCPQRCQQR
ncbi:hypothetical protein [Luteimonas chenhongjianii]|uniref:hypothetical protein n=1 Tax=Luteimonas chenhongjianii TaxID=2006110 RepID=UPI0012FDA846|nr:hypothetical protein [Luteimonas chenhongjianii]